MARIVLTVSLPPAVEQALRANYDVETVRLRDLGPDRFLAEIGTPRAIVPAPGDRLDRALIDRLPDSVGLLASYSVGLDHVDLEAARARNIAVTNTPDVLTAATADIALLLILGAARGAGDGERLIRSGGWTGWSPQAAFGVDVAGKTLGIWGMGRIGEATARRARAFDMTIVYHNRRPNPRDAEIGARFEPGLDAFLSGLDILSLHLPLTEKTRHALNAERIARLKPGTIVVNTGRGDLIDEDALFAALAGGHIRAAGIDVYHNEPDIDPRWLTAPHTVLLPHLGSSTEETRAAMGAKVAANIAAYLDGRPLPDRVV